MRSEDKRKPRKPQGPPPTLTRTDLRRISETAASCGITDEEVEEMVLPRFGVKALKFLRSQDVQSACQIVAAEGEQRLAATREQAEAEKAEAERRETSRAERVRRQKAAVRATRADWAENSNRARVARRRTRKATKRR